MTPEELKQLVSELEELIPEKKFWILDPRVMTDAEQAETLREAEEYDRKARLGL